VGLVHQISKPTEKDEERKRDLWGTKTKAPELPGGILKDARAALRGKCARTSKWETKARKGAVKVVQAYRGKLSGEGDLAAQS